MPTAWLADIPGVRVVRPGADEVELALDPGIEPDTVLTAAIERGIPIRKFEIVEPSLEQVFIERVGRPVDDDATLDPAGTDPDERPRGRPASATEVHGPGRVS